MSTLQQTLAARRAAEAASARPGVSAQAPVPALAVRSTDGHRWVFPWAHLVFADYEIESEDERIIIMFVSHQVQLRGVRLGTVVEAIAGLRLESAEHIPPEFRDQVPESDPCIEAITVLGAHSVSSRQDSADSPKIG